MKAFTASTWWLVLGIFLTGAFHVDAYPGYFFVTAPNVIRFNHNERILVNVFNEDNDVQVDIWLQIPGNDKRFSETTVTVNGEDEPTSTTIRVIEEHLFPTNKTTDKPKFVTLYATSSRHGTFSRNILISYDTGYIIMQTSKPIYHPTDEVRVRVLALTESLQAATGWNISMDLIGPTSNKSYGRITKTDVSHKFFVDAFRLPPNAEKGLWTIRAFFGGQYVTEARTTFRVKEYVLPTFGVTVAVDQKVILLNNTDTVTITVKAEYVYKKPVKGQAVVKVGCITNDGTTQFLPEQISQSLIEGETNIDVNIQDFTNLIGYFPLGQHLLIKARVVERATGKEETGGNKQTLFSEHMYKVSFEKSKKTYRPGFAYHLRVVVQLANGEAQSGLDVTAEQNGEQVEVTKKTDSNGYVLFAHNVAANIEGQLKFRVTVADGHTEELTIDSYKGENLLQVDQREKGNNMIIRATTTIKGNRYSGIMTLITSRGEYIDNLYFQPGTSIERTVEDRVIEQISSEAWVVGFYVDLQTGKLTADSSRFTVTPRCRGSGLTLQPEETVLPPDGSQTLTITGSPSMGVGLNVMDEALILLENSNILKKEKMFSILKSHDVGCGQGGGQTAGEVLRDAGLIIVTNAVIDEADLKRESLGCSHHSRRKRALDCGSSSKYQCCKLGEEFAEKLIEESKDEKKVGNLPDPYTKCLAQTMKIEMMKQNGKNKYSFACLQHHLLKCIEVFIEGIQENRLGKSIFDDGDDYISALQEINVDIRDLTFRDDFKDSWFFNEYDLDDAGQIELNMVFPSSITTWMIQAIGISETAGPCVAEPMSVKSYKPFFIQLDMPYKASRLEYFEIKATVFYYGNAGDQSKVSLYLEGNKFLCTGVKQLQTKKVANFTVKQNDAYSVRIPVLPLQAGRFPIRVIAVGKVGSTGTHDAIQKNIVVENEGIEVKEQITVCLDPRSSEGQSNCTHRPANRVTSEVIDDYQLVTLDLTLPLEAIKGTGSASAFLSSNVMDDAVRSIIKGMDNFLVMPTGCAHQTASKLLPLIYVFNYWKQTKQMTTEREQRGNQWIREGIVHQLTYKGTDSYGTFISSSGSTRLTAFVAKSLCQANKAVDNAVNRDKEIVPLLRWLQRHVNSKAAFYDDNPYANFTVGLDKTIRSAKRYLLDLKKETYRNHPYTLAISTYALSMTGKPFSKKVWRMFNLLKEIGQRDAQKDHLYWNYNQGGIGAFWSMSRNVEATSYALLACIKFGDWKAAADIVRWLIYHRTTTGSFSSTDDTVIALQALAEYNANIYSDSVNLDVKLSSEGWVGRSEVLTTENSVILDTITDIPAKLSKTTVQVVTKGIGTGRMVIDYRYNRLPTKAESCSFNIENVHVVLIDDTNNLIQYNTTRNCDVCGKCEDDNEANDNLIRQDDVLQINPVADQANQDPAPQDANNEESNCFDTVIALQALAEYNANIYSDSVNLDVKLSSEGWVGRSEVLTTENSVILDTITDIPAKLSKTTVQVVTKGIGTGRMVIDYRYNRLPTKAESCSFNIENVHVVLIDDTNNLIQYNTTRNCDVCGKCEDDNEANDNLIRQDDVLQINPVADQANQDPAPQDANNEERKPKQYCVSFKISSLENRRHGMSIVDFGLETEVTVDKDDLEKLKRDRVIDEYEMPGTGKGFFILYLDKITNEPKELKFKLFDNFEGDDQTRQPSSIRVYDYYLPEYRCVHFYGTGTRDGSPVPHHCDTRDGNREEACTCLRNLCPEANVRSSVEKIYKERRFAIKVASTDEEKRNARNRPTPAEILQDHTCDNTKADFAVLVNVTEIKSDFNQMINNAKAVIHKVIHPGRQEYNKNDEIELYWKMNCEWIKNELKLNRPYYLISKDGEYSDSAGGKKLYNRYELMDTTIFVEQSSKKDLFKGIMNKYEELMADGCRES